MKRSYYKEELQRISQQNYAPILQNAGFRSYKNDTLNWYRVENGIAYHIHILMYRASWCSVMTLFYGVHPTFLQAPTHVSISSTDFDGAFSREVLIRYPLKPKTLRFCCPSPEVGINVPQEPGFGVNQVREELFPLFTKLRTRMSVYEWHMERLNWQKQYYAEKDKTVRVRMSPDLVDEVIWFNDREHYDWAMESIAYKINNTVDLIQPEKSERMPPGAKQQLMAAKAGRRSLDDLYLQFFALQDKGEEEYKKHLQMRELSFLAKIEREFGNTVCK